MTDYSAFYNSDAAGMVQRAQPAAPQPAPAPAPTSFESLDLNERRQAAPHMGGPSAGYQYRIACDRVACGEWEGRVELGIIDGNCMQLVFEDEPPLGIGLDHRNIVVEMDPSGAAARSEQIQVGDELSMVDGVEVRHGCRSVVEVMQANKGLPAHTFVLLREKKRGDAVR